MKSKSGLLVFLEFVDEAEVFLKEHGNELHSERNNITIISFHPLVKSYLLKQQIKVTDSFNFCPTESHRKLLCIVVRLCCRARSTPPDELLSYVPMGEMLKFLLCYSGKTSEDASSGSGETWRLHGSVMYRMRTQRASTRAHMRRHNVRE
jgi:hypothetical protein